MHFLHGKVLYITFIAGDKEEETSKKEEKKLYPTLESQPFSFVFFWGLSITQLSVACIGR